MIRSENATLVQNTVGRGVGDEVVGATVTAS